MIKSLKKLKERTYYVQGMHCASCELLIEKKLLKNKNIEAVEASASHGQVVVFYKKKKPSIKKMNKRFKENGYTFFLQPPEDKKENPFLSLNRNGHLLINKNKFFRFAQIFSVALFIAIGFIFLSRSEIASRVVVSSSSALPAFFLFGLLAGASSCAALIGGLVLSMSKQWSGRLQPHLLFNLGRLLAFATLGAFLGALGTLLQISLITTSLLAIAVSILMVFLALQMLGVRRFQKFQITLPKFISRFVTDETNFQGRHMPFLLGALTFFLPCGFTITVQGLALTSGSSWRGSLILLSFALGTLPMLSVIGLSTLKLTARPHLSDQFLKIAGLLVLFFGLYNFNSQLNVLGLPSLNDIRLHSSETVQASVDGLAPVINGKQLLKMDAFAYRYQPNEFKVRAGLPVRWEIKNQGVSGCTNAIVSRGLFPDQIRLDQDINVKEFTPQSPGRYKFSCWMGMVSGTIDVVDKKGSVDTSKPVIESGTSGCGGTTGGGCTGGCGGGCGNPGCPYAQ